MIAFKNGELTLNGKGSELVKELSIILLSFDEVDPCLTIVAIKVYEAIKNRGDKKIDSLLREVEAQIIKELSSKDQDNWAKARREEKKG